MASGLKPRHKDTGLVHRVAWEENWAMCSHIRNQPSQPWWWNTKLKVTDTIGRGNWSRYLHTDRCTFTISWVSSSAVMSQVFLTFGEVSSLTVCVNRRQVRVHETGRPIWEENSITWGPRNDIIQYDSVNTGSRPLYVRAHFGCWLL